MAEKTEHVILDAQFKADMKEMKKAMNAIANVGNFVASSFTRIIGVTLQLEQNNFGLIRSMRAVRDAKRELNRESRRGFELDVEQSKLNVQLAERQRLLTARTGRTLDVMQANLNVKKAIRDVDTAQFAIDDKTRKNREALFDAETQLRLAMKQRELMMIQLKIQMGILFTTFIALIAARWADIKAQFVSTSLLTKGAFIGAGIAIIGASIAAVNALTPDMPTPPGGQTEVGQVRRIEKGGLMEVHTDEIIGRPGPARNTTTSTSSAVINIQSSGTTPRDIVFELKRRYLGQHSTQLYTPRGIM